MTGVDDLRLAMQTIRRAAKLTYQQVADASRRLADIADISKSTAENIAKWTVAPREDSLRAYLRSCGLDPETTQAWVDAATRLGGETTSPVAPRQRESSSHRRDHLSTTALWRALRKQGTFAQVSALVEEALPMLDGTPHTGATYCRFDSEHAIAVIENIGALLGQDVQQLSDLEVALLVLAAVYHDVGVPSVPNLKNVPTQRVLDLLCRSQSGDSEALRGPEFRTNYHGADLRFCAILLRLAAALDFHGPHSAEPIYRQLGINDVLEWRQIAMPGRFEVGDRHTLRFSAVPKHPAAERDLYKMLDGIEAELLRCSTIVEMCSQRWRDFRLPSRIDRTQVTSDGYTYAEFRFELDRAGALGLFTGERLYESPYVFVRELLQNAFDAVRLRSLLDGQPHSGEVDITCWEDDEGNVWFRVEDDGIGMDMPTIHDYFLRIGISFYESPELRALLGLLPPGQRFGAISRYGIGILSCLILGDRIEVSTMRYDRSGNHSKPIRLSYHKSEDFFVTWEEPQLAPPMPAPTWLGRLSYRTKPGTVIAVRINTGDNDVAVGSLVQRVEEHVFYPPFTVRLNGKRLPDWTDGLIAKPLFAEPRTTVIRAPKLFGEKLPYPSYPGPVEFWATPIDVTGLSPDTRLTGQLVGFGARFAEERKLDRRRLSDLWPADLVAAASKYLRQRLRSSTYDYWIDDVSTSSVIINCGIDAHVIDQVAEHFGLTPQWEQADKERWIDSVERRPSSSQTDPADRAILISFSNFLGQSDQDGDESKQYLVSTSFVPSLEMIDGSLPRLLSDDYQRWCGHNGIAIPGSTSGYSWGGGLDLSKSSQFRGVLSLHDDLRVDLSLARDAVVGGPTFAVRSAIHLAVLRALAKQEARLPDGMPDELLDSDLIAPSIARVMLGEVLDEISVVGERGWPVEPMYRVGGERVDLAQIRALAATTAVTLDPFAKEPLAYRRSTMDTCAAALIQQRLDVVWRPNADGTGAIIVVSDKAPSIARGLRHFDPLFFVRYESDTCLQKGEGPLNANHPLCEWLVGNAVELSERMPGRLSRLQRLLGHVVSPSHHWYELQTLAEELNSSALMGLGDEDRSDNERSRPYVMALLRECLVRIARAAPDLAPPPEAYEFD